MITLDQLRTAVEDIDPVFLHTPQYLVESLGGVMVKVETANPIRSFKGRGAGCYVNRLPDAEPLVCASAGNFGQGMAYAARARGIALHVFAAVNANPLKLARMRALGAHVELTGHDVDEAKVAAERFARREGWRYVEDGREPDITMGAGTIGLELAQWRSRLDAVYVPVGNGALVGGVGVALKTLRPEIRVVGVCAEGAPAMERSWRSRSVVVEKRLSTIADGIAVRVPVPYALEVMHAVVDEMVLVSDAEIRQAMALAQEHCGLILEPAGAAGLAAVLQQQNVVPHQHYATILCGGNTQIS